MDEMIERGLSAKRESKYVEFKENFDTSSTEAWCEIVKDIIAISNTGGGVLIFGLNNIGQPVGADIQPVLDLDPAEITDKISKYTGIQFSEFSISEHEKGGHKLAAMRIFRRRTPVVFSKPGTYPVQGGKQGRAFSQGTVYFRHGAKSEPGITEDLRKVLRDRISEVRQELLSGLRKVIEAPSDHEVVVMPREIIETQEPGAAPIRIVDDEGAPSYRKIDRDLSHPYRHTELVEAINDRLPKGSTINTYDVLAVRKVHGIDDNEDFCYSPKYSTNQYSQAAVEWIARQFHEDPDFFDKARSEYKQMRNDA